ncbi:MAG: acyltransferase [Solobacterium sp.]|nr:acyltransferase [Solobacterium sp.]
MKRRQTQKQKRSQNGFSFLKTVALVGVLLYHTFPQAVKGGYFGVVIFFIASGYFAACSSFRQAKAGIFSIPNYYKKRLVRIYPGLLILLLSSIGILTLIDPNLLRATVGEFLSIIFGYNNFYQIANNADYFRQITANTAFTHLWYLSILLQFWLVWPLLTVLIDQVRRRFGSNAAIAAFGLITLLSMAVLPFRVFTMAEFEATPLYYNTFTRMSALYLGCFLGLLHAENIFPLRRIRLPAALLGTGVWLAATIALFVFADGSAKWVYTFGLQGYAVFTVLIAAMIAVRKKNSPLICNSIVGTIDSYSYEVYLLQYPVLFIYQRLVTPLSALDYLLQIVIIIVLSAWLNRLSTIIADLLLKKK